MKKIFLIGLLFTLLIPAAFAQRGMQGERPMERIHAAKMAYITDRLRLSSDQTIHFTPIYTEYEQEVRDTRRKYLQKYKGINPDEADDATSRQYIDDNLDLQQELIQIKRKYNDRFLKVISVQQLADLAQAEREFKQILMQRLKERKENGRNGGRWH